MRRLWLCLTQQQAHSWMRESWNISRAPHAPAHRSHTTKCGGWATHASMTHGSRPQTYPASYRTILQNTGSTGHAWTHRGRPRTCRQRRHVCSQHSPTLLALSARVKHPALCMTPTSTDLSVYHGSRKGDLLRILRHGKLSPLGWAWPLGFHIPLAACVGSACHPPLPPFTPHPRRHRFSYTTYPGFTVSLAPTSHTHTPFSPIHPFLPAPLFA